jgi:hypothetical protein
LNIEEIYTPLEIAREEIRRRWNDLELRKNVEEFLGGAPFGTVSKPVAYLWRAVHTPNREFHRFIEQAKVIGLQPLALEAPHDRFCTMNPDKLGLLKLTFVTGTNIHGEPIIRRVKIADMNLSQGLPFISIKTLWGDSFVDVHHRLLKECFPEITPMNHSPWLFALGSSPKAYYPASFAMAIYHGVLFEDYIEGSHETPFIQDVICPTFEAVYSRFGIKPLIVPLAPENTSHYHSWAWYDPHVAKIFSQPTPQH